MCRRRDGGHSICGNVRIKSSFGSSLFIRNKWIPSSAELIFPGVKKVISSTILSGRSIILGSFIEEDIKKIIQWHSDEKIMRNLGALPVKPKQETEIKKWLDECPQDTFRFSPQVKRSK